MDEPPFHIRPVNYNGDDGSNSEKRSSVISFNPLSIPDDLSAKITISSKFVAVDFAEISVNLKKKNIDDIIEENKGKEIIIPTNIALQLMRAEDEVDVELKPYFSVPLLFGFLAGIIVIMMFREDIPKLLVVTVSLAAFLGCLVGFVWQRFYEARVKKFAQEWAKRFLEE